MGRGIVVVIRTLTVEQSKQILQVRHIEGEVELSGRELIR